MIPYAEPSRKHVLLLDIIAFLCEIYTSARGCGNEH